jgi:methylmalonyl-CoA decarboxylase subunit alpha
VNWDEMLADLADRHQEAREEPHVAGSPTARERIAALLDAGSFHEVGVLASAVVWGDDGFVSGSRTSSTVCGFGRIDGRPVIVASEGRRQAAQRAAGRAEKPKSGWDGYAERLALQYRLPLVLLLDGYGGSNSSGGNRGYPYAVTGMRTDVLWSLLDQSPVIVGVLGEVAGLAAARVVASHFSVMAEDHGRVFSGPPSTVAGLSPEQAAALGGPRMQAAVAGNVRNVAADEAAVFDQIRRFLSFMPSNVFEAPPHKDTGDPPDRRCDELLQIVTDNRRRAYNTHELVRAVVDNSTFFEISPRYGRSILAGLARIAGEPVGILASDSRYGAGAIEVASAEKQTYLVELCDTFHLPIVYFADVPGLMIGVAAERSGLMRRGVRAMQAMHRATTPVFTVQVRRSFGLGGGMTGSPNRLSVKIAWPSGEWGDMPIEGGVAAGYRKELAEAEDPDALRREIEARLREEASIWRTAEAFGVEEIIDPRDTRRVLCEWLAVAVSQRSAGKKAGPQVRP